MTFGDSLSVSFCEGADPIHNAVQILSYAEAGETSIGLAHGEAIKLFSLFYNLETKGNELFDEIEVNKLRARKAILSVMVHTPISAKQQHPGEGWFESNIVEKYRRPLLVYTEYRPGHFIFTKLNFPTQQCGTATMIRASQLRHFWF